MKLDQRCFLSASATDTTTSKPNSGNPETKSSGENEKSGGSESSDGGSDQKNDRGASGKDVRGAVNFIFSSPFLFDNCVHEQVSLMKLSNRINNLNCGFRIKTCFGI